MTCNESLTPGHLSRHGGHGYDAVANLRVKIIPTHMCNLHTGSASIKREVVKVVGVSGDIMMSRSPNTP